MTILNRLVGTSHSSSPCLSTEQAGNKAQLPSSPWKKLTCTFSTPDFLLLKNVASYLPVSESEQDGTCVRCWRLWRIQSRSLNEHGGKCSSSHPHTLSVEQMGDKLNLQAFPSGAKKLDHTRSTPTFLATTQGTDFSLAYLRASTGRDVLQKPEGCYEQDHGLESHKGLKSTYSFWLG